MFSRRSTGFSRRGTGFSRRSTADRTAAQAWDYLSSAVTAAGDNAKSTARRSSGLLGVASDRTVRLAGRAGRRTGELTDEAGSRVESAADEAWRRANVAADALAGRRPRLPWRLVAAAAVVGVAVGWAAAATVRAALERRAENDQLELAETPDVPMPTFDN